MGIADMRQDERFSEQGVWGDLICTECFSVITSLSVAEPGVYDFVKVSDWTIRSHKLDMPERRQRRQPKKAGTLMEAQASDKGRVVLVTAMQIVMKKSCTSLNHMPWTLESVGLERRAIDAVFDSGVCRRVVGPLEIPK